jgi:hypothetical protein
LPVRDFLTHQALLPGWIPFWRMGLDKDGKLNREIFAQQPSDHFQVRISEHLYLNGTILNNLSSIPSEMRNRFLQKDMSIPISAFIFILK